MMDLKKSFDKVVRLFFGSESRSRIPKGDTYFLLIGINEYKREKKLNFCIDDSEHILELWDKKQSVKIKKKNIYKLYDSNATKINIIERLKDLTKSIRSNDQLIIHVSGHGFNSLESQFFVPFDGYHRNIYSCISSVSLNSYITEFNASNVFLIINTWNANPTLNTSNRNKELDQFINKSFTSEVEREKNIYDDLIDFLKVDSIQRNKEIFLFSKKPMEKMIREDPILGEWNINDKELKSRIELTKIEIQDMISEGNIEEALNSMDKILENNDFKLNSQVRTLKYKLEEIKRLKSEVRELEYKTTEHQISNLSKGIINQIDKKGFYLVNLPNEQIERGIQKKRTIILFTSADPSDQSTLRLNDEYRNIEFELMRSKNRDDFELIPCLASRIGDFQRKLLNIRPQIIHFSGHGENEGICLIGDECGSSDIIENEPLSELFRLFSKDIQCVFLNSCHSINQSKLIGKHIEHIICMNNSVNDKTAIHFATSFYAALSSGQDIGFSFEFAKNSIDLHKLSGSDIPQLLVRSN